MIFVSFHTEIRCSEHLFSNIQVSGRCRQVSCQVFQTPALEYSGVLSSVPNTCFRIFGCLAGVVRCPVRCFEHLFSNMQVSRQVSRQVFRAPVFEYSGVWQVSSGVVSSVSSICFRIFRCPERLFSNIQVFGRCRVGSL